MHVIACMPIIAGDFPQEKEVIAAELGGQPREALQILTFSLCKASLSAYSKYRMHI
jgi:hypothetical protein